MALHHPATAFKSYLESLDDFFSSGADKNYFHSSQNSILLLFCGFMVPSRCCSVLPKQILHGPCNLNVPKQSRNQTLFQELGQGKRSRGNIPHQTLLKPPFTSWAAEKIPLLGSFRQEFPQDSERVAVRVSKRECPLRKQIGLLSRRWDDELTIKATQEDSHRRPQEKCDQFLG